MRRLLCLAVAGLFQLPGPASAAVPPSWSPGPDRHGPQAVSPLPPYSGDSVQARPGPSRSSSGDRPSRSAKALVLSVAQGEKPMPATGHALLLCDRPGSTHPDAVGACEALAEVRGDPARIRPLSGVACTMQYDPVTVTAMGIWNGRFIRFEQTFGSACSLRAATGSVFLVRNQRGGH
ncbi:SSI family serine proteinase inhibitor [Streptosporangium sp. NPDC023615]|uniref:SSI family serine proteinase inhibitor n=1 Tax=Streptosporangium sp. NPDC023615 TaxID=3154794 RepID=UPI00343FF7AC